MSDRSYLTLDQVHEELDRADMHRLNRGAPPANREMFEHFGFSCIYNFCKVSKGWVRSFEDCCPNCVASIVKNYGSQADKEHFNAVQTLGDSYIIPITKKELAIANKRKYKRTRKTRVKMKRKGARKRLQRKPNKDHQEFLKRLRKANVPILRRTKSKAKNDLVMVSPSRELSKKMGCPSFGAYVYVKGVLPQSGYLHVSSESGLKGHVDRIAKKHGVNAPESILVF
ncbi:hypothetical protein [Vibrio owensii]|uniref:hypothetical protein n=1 Tax=Vibrio owensii TaxID=696485 RepID=UPI003CC65C12